MRTLDRSKAPAGATHWDTLYEVFCCEHGWWRDGNEIFVTDENYGWGSSRYLTLVSDDLPAIGEEIEVLCNKNWLRAKVIAYRLLSDTAPEIVAQIGQFGEVHSVTEGEWRPLKTPEQVEAEKVLEERRDLSDLLTSDVLADIVLRAGYRKVQS